MFRLYGFLIIFVSFHTNNAANELPTYKFYSIVSEQHIGEQNQIKGLVYALKRKLEKGDKATAIEVHEAPFQDVMLLRKRIEDDKAQKKIIVASGESGLIALEELKNTPNAILIHTSHQSLANHKKIIDIAHFIIIPRYAVDEPLRSSIRQSKISKLVETSGVVHNSSPQESLKAYHNNINLIVPAPFYIVVMLGGDVSSENKILYFSESYAEKLALYVKKIARKKDAHIIVINGPRTGKYDPKTGSIDERAHRNGIIDMVTRKFISILKSPPHKVAYSLFDFQYGEKISYSNMAYGLLLEKRKGFLFIPGDSDSFVSEGADLFPGDVIVYRNEAMAPTSKVHVDLELRLKRINVLNQNMKLRKSRLFGCKIDSLSIAEQVVEQIIDSGVI